VPLDLERESAHAAEFPKKLQETARAAPKVEPVKALRAGRRERALRARRREKGEGRRIGARTLCIRVESVSCSVLLAACSSNVCPFSFLLSPFSSTHVPLSDLL
jgi:hypothetical protein